MVSIPMEEEVNIFSPNIFGHQKVKNQYSLSPWKRKFIFSIPGKKKSIVSVPGNTKTKFSIHMKKKSRCSAPGDIELIFYLPGKKSIFSSQMGEQINIFGHGEEKINIFCPQEGKNQCFLFSW